MNPRSPFPLRLIGVLAVLGSVLIIGATMASRQVTVARQLGNIQGALPISPGQQVVQRFAAPDLAADSLTIPFQPVPATRAIDVAVRLTGSDGRRLDQWYVSNLLLNTQSVDLPLSGAPLPSGTLSLQLEPLRGQVVVEGWAVDRTAVSGSGIDRMALFRDGLPGKGIYLGQAHVGLPSPRVAQALGAARFGSAGWQFVWNTRGVPAGRHTLYVFAHSSASGNWSGASRPVRLATTLPGPASGPRLGFRLAPVVLGGIIEVVTDNPPPGAIYGRPVAVQIPYERTRRYADAQLVVGGKPYPGALAISLQFHVPLGRYLLHGPALLVGAQHGYPQGMIFDAARALPSGWVWLVALCWLLALLAVTWLAIRLARYAV